jgi:hypothetical protein
VTRPEFVAILTPLTLAMRAELDGAGWTAYYRAFSDVPPALLSQVIERMLREPLSFFPKAGELRAECEKQRRAILAIHPYEGCVECEHSKGFREVIGASGQTTVEPCPCKARHRERLEGLGVGTPLASLPGEAEAQSEQVYPTVEQLPAAMRQTLLETVKQKVLR